MKEEVRERPIDYAAGQRNLGAVEDTAALRSVDGAEEELPYAAGLLDISAGSGAPSRRLAAFDCHAAAAGGTGPRHVPRHHRARGYVPDVFSAPGRVLRVRGYLHVP